ncbi:hypothetical protein Tco_1418886 [Tanacetum coccineum]
MSSSFDSQTALTDCPLLYLGVVSSVLFLAVVEVRRHVVGRFCTAFLEYLARSAKFLLFIPYPPSLFWITVFLRNGDLGLRVTVLRSLCLCVCYWFEMFSVLSTAAAMKNCDATEAISSLVQARWRSFRTAAMILLCIWLSVEDVLTGVDMMNE